MCRHSLCRSRHMQPPELLNGGRWRARTFPPHVPRNALLLLERMLFPGSKSASRSRERSRSFPPSLQRPSISGRLAGSERRGRGSTGWSLAATKHDDSSRAPWARTSELQGPAGGDSDSEPVVGHPIPPAKSPRAGGPAGNLPANEDHQAPLPLASAVARRALKIPAATGTPGHTEWQPEAAASGTQWLRDWQCHTGSGEPGLRPTRPASEAH